MVVILVQTTLMLPPIADDGTCEYLGCTDSSADNFDATANLDDGSCEYLGCTDSSADNFDSTANVDDGTCEYFQVYRF